MHTDAGKADVAMKYFRHRLTDGVKEGLPTFIGEPRPLDNPIPLVKYPTLPLSSSLLVLLDLTIFRTSWSRTLIPMSIKCSPILSMTHLKHIDTLVINSIGEGIQPSLLQVILIPLQKTGQAPT